MRTSPDFRFGLLVVVGFFVAGLLGGCSKNPLVLQGKVEKLETEHLALKNQNEQLQGRTNSLDRDNQELDTLLAQSRQQSQLLQDQLGKTRQELAQMTAKWEGERKAKEANETQVKTMTASLQRRGNVSIRPNSSIQRTLPVVEIPGLQPYKVGEAIRIPVPADRLFDQGTVRLRPGADKLITQIADQIRQNYPQQMVGVEGYTDRGPVTGAYRNHHELSIAQALAVHNVLASQGRIGENQMVVTGRGPTRPHRANGPGGVGAWNNRVEIVIYPETAR